MSEQYLKNCQRCGASFLGGPLGRYCMKCRKKISSESASRRRLWDYGAKGRWGYEKEKPQWIGPSAELMREDTEQEERHAERKT